jgi:hypothetical protein
MSAIRDDTGIFTDIVLAIVFAFLFFWGFVYFLILPLGSDICGVVAGGF